MRKRKMKMLVVDDLEINRVSLVTTFSNEFEVFEASDGQEAIHILELNGGENLFVLLDIVMPKRDGFEVLSFMKSDIRLMDIPVIVVTSFMDVENEIRALDLGADDVIARPFDDRVLLKRMQNVIAVHEVKRLRRKNERDSLTTLLNRETFQALVDSYLEGCDNSQELSALVIIDVDNFKGVNDNFGHDYGDEVLIEIAKRIGRVFRKEDLVGRLGGDEFCVFLLPGITIATMLNKMEELCEKLSMKLERDGKIVQISCSAGVSFAPIHGNTFHSLYRKSDEAQYIAKNSGKNRFNIFMQEG